MDSDDEDIFTMFLEEEIAAATKDEEHMQILGSLARVYTQTIAPKCGGLAKGRRKCKARQWMEGYCMMYADYFADESLHEEVMFRHNFSMSRKLFLEIVHAIQKFD